jgi:membrane protein implicated in regulation of membrane protease activity
MARRHHNRSNGDSSEQEQEPEGSVVELIYWRDPRKSGVVFGSILAILLSLSVVSFISVVSYASLAVLAITLSFRLYKNVLQAVQKTQDGHPFKEYLEIDVTIPSEKVHEVADLSAARLNAALVELRRLFLVEDLIDSFKFGLALWSLTYVGAWFNGITLVILAFIGLFAFPKVYETHQEKIDQNVDLVRGKINEIVDKVTAVLPIGKKPKSQ